MTRSTTFKMMKVPTTPKNNRNHNTDCLIEDLPAISVHQSQWENFAARIFERIVHRVGRKDSG